MLSSNKFKYIVFSLSMLGLFTLWQINDKKSAEDLSCAGTLRKNAFLPDNSQAMLDTSYYLLVGKGSEGLVNYNGSMMYNGSRFKIDRTLRFHYRHEEGSYVFRFDWKDMYRASDDTLPANLEFIIHSTEKQSYFSLRKLESNIMTINKNGFPLFACVLR